MKIAAKSAIAMCVLVFWLFTLVFAQTTDQIAYPEGYRRWVHIDTKVVGPESPAFKKYGGIHSVYANPTALEGFKTGHFPDGSIIVFDLFEAQTKSGATFAGPRKFIDVMVKDEKRFIKTAGWGYEEFTGDSRTDRVLTEDQKVTCAACHASRKDTDSVFSTFKD